jgi:peptide deformylase
MIRPILTVPDPALRRRALPITKFDERLADYISDMFDSMYHANGIGLAAPQLGSSRRLFILDIAFTKTPNTQFVYINPHLLGQHGSQVGEEGCLSIPNVKMQIARPYHIVVRYDDINGETHEASMEALAARAFCHELDHLNGILLTDLEDAGILGVKF